MAAVEGFRSGKHPVLVATDIAARGLDIEGIAHVVNYEVPDTPDTYVHRVGRTGRSGASGHAVTLVSPAEERNWRSVEQSVGFDVL
jgi:superfamily II DNA/RNA helicase